MEQMLHLNFFIILAFLLAITVVLFAMVKLFRNFQRSFSAGNRCNIITALLLPVILLLPFYKNGLTKLLVPAYPLVELNSRQLLIVQNSFHTFAYSLFRGGQEVNIREYMPVAECDSIFPIRKTLRPAVTNGTGRNIVLFIMESVPYEFFDTGSAYKVAMPFFDSLLQKSSFFKNAFCYTHQSNKGITAILAGIPTLSDIPLYHSSYINMPVTAIGTALMKKNYHSFFCIGDDFDNFGFAKCVHWLGIEDYYSRENIPDNKKLPAHSMGLHDQYVLDFMLGQINRLTPPFLAVNFNISTHYPYDLPATYNTSFPANYTKPMKSMSYYDHCLQKFFRAAETEPWFKQTVFIFCSDHWLVPDDNKFKFNSVDGFRIPIILYDPSRNEKKINTQPVSQFDIPGTILSLAGFKDSIISYGGNLLDSSSINKVVFSRSNASLYQVIDSAYILGFNINSDKTEFLYHYTTDPGLKINLLPDRNFLAILSELTQKIKAFIQKATMQYNRVPFK